MQLTYSLVVCLILLSFFGTVSESRCNLSPNRPSVAVSSYIALPCFSCKVPCFYLHCSRSRVRLSVGWTHFLANHTPRRPTTSSNQGRFFSKLGSSPTLSVGSYCSRVCLVLFSCLTLTLAQPFAWVSHLSLALALYYCSSHPAFRCRTLAPSSPFDSLSQFDLVWTASVQYPTPKPCA